MGSRTGCCLPPMNGKAIYSKRLRRERSKRCFGGKIPKTQPNKWRGSAKRMLLQGQKATGVLDSFGPKPEHADPYALAIALARVGDKDRAFGLLEKSCAAHSDEFLYNVHGEPAFDAMRSDPRFRDLLRRIGL